MKKDILEQLYIKYGNALRLYIYSMCRDFGAAEEIMQDTFVKAMLTLDENHSNIKAWIYTVGKNLTLNRIKRDRKITYTGAPIEIPENDDALTNLMKNEKEKHLYEAILTLKPKMRQVIILHYYSELSFGKIGEMLGITHGDARNTAYRARKILKERLEEKDDV